jgi:hypothetical protein
MMDWLEDICRAAKADAMGLSNFDCHCIDCGVNTAPAIWTDVRECIPALPETWEMYWLLNKVWAAAGVGELDGALCIGCIENRLGRRLKPKDFDHSSYYNRAPGCTRRLKSRRGY